jgi:hypothetical protein
MMIRRAFTMVELLVATAATMILVLFLNQIFSSLSAATSMGRSTSIIIENARVIGPQIIADAEEIIGPAGGGFLVVVNHIANPGGLVNLTRESQGPVNFPLRSDQVMWVRNRLAVDQLAPGSEDAYQNASGAGMLRVWYGHGLRTLPDGFGPVAPTMPVGPPFLGQAGSPSAYAVDWIFARQALHLDATATVPRTPGDTRTYADSGAYAAAVDYYNTAPPTNPQNPLLLYRGLTDLVAGDIAQFTGAAGAFTNPDKTEYMNVYDALFVKERLRVNPEPSGSESWQIAQMHPFLVDRCVSFAVHFAGNYHDESTDPAFTAYFTALGVAPYDLEVDITPGYSGTDVNGVSYTLPAGLTKWYAAALPNISNDPGVAGFDSTKPLSFQPPPAPVFDAPWTDADTPIYDPAGGGAVAPFADAAFIFRDGVAADANWPKLLRFQYRLIDARGVLVGADGLPGKTFEQIIKIDP